MTERLKRLGRAIERLSARDMQTLTRWVYRDLLMTDRTRLALVERLLDFAEHVEGENAP